VCSGQHGESNDVNVFLDRGRGDGLGCLKESGVDDFHSRVTQESRNDLDAAIVTVETYFRDENSKAHSEGTST
jgi:hypothetical protein